MMRKLRIILLLLLLGLSLALIAKPKGPKSPLSVKVVGVDPVYIKAIKKRLRPKLKVLAHRPSASAVMNLYENIPTQIEKTLKPYGYFTPQIYSSILQKKNHWYSTFRINPGPQIKITKLTLKISGPGHYDKAYQQLIKIFPVKVGDGFSAENYNEGKQAFFDIASSLGYFHAKMVQSNIYIDIAKREAHVVFRFSTGPRFRFGKTTFSKIPLQEAFLRRYLRYHEGEYYDAHKIQVTRQDLSGSQYFRQVIVTPDMDEAKNNIIPVKIVLSMQKPRQYNFGAGFGTDTGVRLLIGTYFRWVNQWGHSINTYLRLSQISSALTFNYIIPGSNPAINRYILTATLQDFDQVTGNGRSGKLAFQYQTLFMGWQQTSALNYLRESYNLTDYPKTNADLLYPSLTWARKHTDKLLNPTSGYNFVFGVEAASKGLGSKNSFSEWQFSGKTLFTLVEGTRLLLRSQIAAVSIAEIDTLPLSLQLFAGGAQSIRGYSYQSIGPGRELFVGSVELQQHIFSSFYLAGFVDTGNVSNNIFNEKLKVGVGPGFVWLSPIGAFELTIGEAINQPTRPVLIQFVMGETI